MPKGIPGSSQICAVDECPKEARARGWCKVHWQNWKRHGDPAWKPPGPQPCIEDDCDKPRVGLERCQRHYRAERKRLGFKRSPVVCSMDGCPKTHRAHGLCDAHYYLWRKYGDPTSGQWVVGSDDIGYPAAHARVRALYGSASEHLCIWCHGSADEWAYLGSDNEKWVKKGERTIAYSPDPDAYRPLCKSCHVRHDQIVASAAAVP